MNRPPSSSTAIHSIMRRPLPTVIIAASVLLLAALPSLPAAREAIGVGANVTLPFAVAFVFATCWASWQFHRDRHAKAYVWINRLETAVTTLGCIVPIMVSAQPSSIFWFLFLGVSLHAGTSGADPKLNLVLVASVPTILIAYFLAIGNAAGAGVALAIGTIGIYVYWTLSAAARRLSETIEERDRLAAQIADLTLQTERARIARDLHDGVGAELAALIWRARRLQAELDRSGGASELRELEERVYAGVEELRAIVWALRSAPLAIEEWKATLRERCAEMCGNDLRLRFECNLESLPDAMQQSLARLVWECARNAVRHAKATELAIVLRGDADALSVTVTDNGVGLPENHGDSKGGLRNLRTRTEELGGTIDFSTPSSAGQGTNIAIVIPLASAARGKTTV